MEKVKSLREKKGFLQKDVANLLEMSEANYSKKEKGSVKFSIAEIQKLADLFECKIEDLVE